MSTQADGEGQVVALDMESWRDVKLLHRALVEGWAVNRQRVEKYLQRLDEVMATTQDPKLIVAGSAVGVQAFRAVTDAIKALLKPTNVPAVQNTQINIGGLDLSKLTDAQLEAYGRGIANAESAGQA